MIFVLFLSFATLFVVLSGIVFVLLWIQACLLVIIRLCEGAFVRAGLWLCLALVPVSIAAGESFKPLCIAIMIAAVSGTVWKLMRRHRKEEAEPVMVEDTSVPVEPTFTLKQNKEGIWVVK